MPAVAEALATMHKGEKTEVCPHFMAFILVRCDLDAQLRLDREGIGDGGAAAIARALASNRTVTWVCVQHRVPAWGLPMWDEPLAGPCLLATCDPQWVGSECWGWPLLCTHVLPSHVIRRWWWHSFALMATSLAMRASRQWSGRLLPMTLCKGSVMGRCSGAGCACVCVCHALIGFPQLVLHMNTLSDAGARALVRLLSAARARPSLNVCPWEASWCHAHNNALLTPRPPMQLWLPGRDASADTNKAFKRSAPAETALGIYWL